MKTIVDFSRAEEDRRYPLDMETVLPDELTGSRGGRFEGGAEIRGGYVFSGGILSADFTIRARALFSCDRCGAPVSVSYDVPVSAMYFRDPPDEFSYAYADEKADFGPAIREAVILATPSRVLCREDCKGLCPVCGKNLNEGECGCRKKESGSGDSPFAVLENLTGGATDGGTEK